jgi:hypothetical protein
VESLRAACLAELATARRRPYDSAIRAALDSEDLQGRYGKPYEGLGVAALDSLDYVLGIREGSLEVRVGSGKLSSRDEAYISLHFGHAGREASSVLLEDGERIPRGRSPFHARALVA